MIAINNDKAIEIAKEKIRAWRDAEFAKNDIAIQNALVDGSDTTEFIERRDYLRDLPNNCEGLTLDELKAKLVELGIEKG
jgi:hypothetical protein